MACQPKALLAQGGERQHCMFFQAKKNKYCGFQRTPGALYCGNHLHLFATGEEIRVPCPANPSHDVPKSELQAHLAKCPKAIAIAAARAQPYFAENINSGHASISLAELLQQQQQQHHTGLHSKSSSSFTAYLASLLDPANPAAAQAAAVAAEAAAPFQRGTAARRQAAAVALGPEGFAALLQRVEAAHAALTSRFPQTRRLLGGTNSIADSAATSADSPANPADSAAVSTAVAAALRDFSLGLDPMMPFDAKHALQHASIVGNMAAAGLLAAPQTTLFVELGAGKGFLTAWLHQVCGASELLLLDLQGNFAKKADRRLRHTCLTRVALDLKDVALLQLMQLHLAGDTRVQDWQQAQRQFRADGLQRKRQKQQLKQQQQQQREQQQQQEKQQQQEEQQEQQQQQEQQREVRQMNGHEQVEAADQQQQQQDVAGYEKGNAQEASEQQQQQAGRRERKRQPKQPKPRSEADTVVSGGLCCCPDRTLQRYPAPLPAIYCKQGPNQPVHPLLLQQDDCPLQQQQQQQQAAVPWVVHGKHLCGAATDFALRACYNAIKQQEMLQQLQQERPPISGSSSNGPCAQQQQQQQLFDFRGLAVATCCHQKAGWTSYVAKQQLAAVGISADDFEVIAWMTSWALCGHEVPPGATLDDTQKEPPEPAAAAAGGTEAEAEAAGAAAAAAAANTSVAQPTSGAGAGAAADDFHPADVMPRSQRMVFGMTCKQLLDAARCAWIEEQLLPAMQQQQQQQQQQRAAGDLRGSSGADEGNNRSEHFGVVRMAYTDLSVTGENTLLLLGVQHCDG